MSVICGEGEDVLNVMCGGERVGECDVERERVCSV